MILLVCCLSIDACEKLTSICVHIGISDYFEDTQRPQHIDEYNQIINKLKVCYKSMIAYPLIEKKNINEFLLLRNYKEKKTNHCFLS